MVNFKKNNKAVSEVLGTVLLLVISVSLFSVVYVSFFAVDVTPNTPSVNIVGAIKEDSLVLDHYGGEPLSLGTKVLLDFNPDGSNRKSVIVDEENYLELDEKQDGEWNIGEDFSLLLSDINGYIKGNPVGVIVVDIVSNSVVMYGTLQEIMQQESSADLGVYSLVCSPSTVANPGESVSVSFTVYNYNLKPANGFEYRIYVDGTEVVYDFKNLNPALEFVFESDVITKSIALPSVDPLNGASYIVKVEIFVLGTAYDADGDVNTGNNDDSFAVALNQVDPEADIQITLGASNYNPSFGSQITITAQVKNNGPGPSNNVNAMFTIPSGVTYASHAQTQGSYSSGTWSIGSLDAGETVQLDLQAKIVLLPQEIEFTQLCIVLDGSHSIESDTFDMMIQGVADAVRNGNIPHVGRVELTVIQFGVNEPFPYPYIPSVVEVGPVILVDTLGQDGYYLNVASEIEGIQKLGGYSPFFAAMQTSANTLKASPNYDSSHRQVINFITDGHPTLKPFQKFPPVSECYELDHGIIVCTETDYPEEIPLDSPSPGIQVDISIFKDYVIDTLEMTEDQDEINGLIVDGIYGNNFDWFRDNVAYPEPGYDNWLPTGPGWVRMVDTSNKIVGSLEHEIHVQSVGREITATVTSDTPEPSGAGVNNQAKITIVPSLS